ncbi:MAG: TOBE domain-containing protein [Thermoleophilia bacterium]|nr:TOBE domain-containing protein [Thermoleophilia bacterium]
MGSIDRRDAGLAVAFGDGQHLSVDAAESGDSLAEYVGRDVIVGVRPEHLEDVALLPDTPADRRLKGLVQLRELLGSEVVVHFQVEAAPVVADEVVEIAQDVDAAAVDELDHLRQSRRTSFVARFGVDTTARENSIAEVAVAAGALRFFDPDTGERVGLD